MGKKRSPRSGLVIRRTSASIVRARIEQVKNLILRGYINRREIREEIDRIENLSEDDHIKMGWVPFQIRANMLSIYIDRAMNDVTSTKIEDNKALKNWIINAHFNMYQEARKKDKMQIAHRTLVQLALLTGVTKLSDVGRFRFDKFDIDLTAEEVEMFESQVSAFEAYEDQILNAEDISPTEEK